MLGIDSTCACVKHAAQIAQVADRQITELDDEDRVLLLGLTRAPAAAPGLDARDEDAPNLVLARPGEHLRVPLDRRRQRHGRARRG